MKDKWQDLQIGALILEAGNSKNFETGDWRTSRPIWDKEKCINCLNCWVYCPDSSIKVENGKMTGIDLFHCKGCGICVKECPSKIQAIKMVPEEK
ncbi:MAG: 4Fe-4S binding protein [bacterium]